MSLVLREETGRTTSTTGRRTSPKDVVRLVFPFSLHIIYIFDDHVDRIPTVGISFGRRKVIMTGDEDIGISNTFGGREHRVQGVNRSPVGEEMALIVVCPWMVAEIVLIVDGFRKLELVCWGGRGDTGVG